MKENKIFSKIKKFVEEQKYYINLEKEKEIQINQDLIMKGRSLEVFLCKLGLRGKRSRY